MTVGAAAAWIAALAACWVPAAHARRRAPEAMAPRASAPAAPHTIERADARLAEPERRLRQAALEQSLGHPREVVACLEPLDFSPEPSFAEADRAALLLAQAYLDLGSRDRFERLADQVAGWKRESPCTRWIARERERLALEAGDSLAVRAVLAPAESDAAPADTATALGRDLAGAALLRRATRALERGEDPRPLLAAVPAGSRYHSRALHLLGQIAFERGDSALARHLFESLLLVDPGYAGRREVMLALAGAAIDRGEWESAYGLAFAADVDWARARDALSRLHGAVALDSLWDVWNSAAGASEGVRLDDAALREGGQRLARAAADLGATPAGEPSALAAPPRAGARGTEVPPPPREDWLAVAASRRRLDERRYQRDEIRWRMARELERLAARRDYLTLGGARIRGEADSLAARLAALDSLKGALETLDRRLRAARDEAARRVVARTAALVAASGRNLREIEAMRHYHVEGPNLPRETIAPPGLPSTDSLTRAEAALAGAVADAAARAAREMPELIARSYAERWRPRLIDRVGDEGASARAALTWARRLDHAIDSCLAASRDSDTLRILSARAAALGRAVDSLGVAHAALRARVAEAAVARALAALEDEREGLDYPLAVASYARALRLGRDGRPMASAGADSARDDDPRDPQGASWRARAIAASRAFLAHHPDSPARGEMRFRLADLLQVDARHAFDERMARYLRQQSAVGSSEMALPVLSLAEPLALYRQILAEDPGFAHRDAVLFDAGSILADQSDPEAEIHLGELVARYPDSPYVQEAELRRGDLHFNRREFVECAPLYEHAAQGPDPTLQVVALYKLGWASYNENHFAEATDAFRRVLDVYETGRRVNVGTDLRPESEAYLVHSLLRSGGARPFAEYFDRIGERPYEARVLMAMGQQLRRFGRFGEAIEVDRLELQRDPLAPEALTSAERLVETCRRWEHPDLERAARLELAPAFAPGGAWARAQSDDSLRAAGAAFARESWLAVARFRHHAAREGGSRDDWREARSLYERVLATWPRDTGAAALHLDAGEASLQLEDYPTALAHFRSAESGSDSAAAQALWEQVAVADTWYRRTTGSGAGAAGAGPGAAAPGAETLRDSLAHLVIANADRLLARFPDHPHAADLEWRQGNLAFAHGWYPRAASDFGRLASQHASDPRAPRAASLRADALFRLGDYAAAGPAYGQALEAARRAGADSLARRAEAAMPTCDYLAAEAAVAADSSAHSRHAAMFEQVAARWPHYEHADRARYRAGLAWLAAGRPKEAVGAFEALAREFPRSEYARDAALERAGALKALGERERAADAYADFAQRFPADSSARNAWLAAADLDAAAGLDARAEALRMDYIRRYPNDAETAMEILEALARRDLDRVDAAHPMSTLLATGAGAAPSRLADYLKRARAHPELASPALLARVRFLQAEESNAACAAVRLTLPLDRSIAARKKRLDDAVAEYRACVDVGVPEWSHAATFRMGEALIGFGEALRASERPADLAGDDLKAYERVLDERAQAFLDRGENAWVALLRRQPADSTGDRWVVAARGAYWHRVADRFLYQSEVEFPVAAAVAPRPAGAESAPRHRSHARARGGGDAARASALREEGER